MAAVTCTRNVLYFNFYCLIFLVYFDRYCVVYNVFSTVLSQLPLVFLIYCMNLTFKSIVIIDMECCVRVFLQKVEISYSTALSCMFNHTYLILDVVYSV